MGKLMIIPYMVAISLQPPHNGDAPLIIDALEDCWADLCHSHTFYFCAPHKGNTWLASSCLIVFFEPSMDIMDIINPRSVTY